MLGFRSLDYNNDLDEVVQLIRENLQPEYSHDFLIWKHLNNPFGPSYSMVATKDGGIVGVLFYMRYNFYNGKGGMVKCIRPVDGCTSSSMRGKGIFKKLMTACLNYYKDDYDLIMATPNSKSFPELLKLGWKKSNENYAYKFGLFVSTKLKRGEALIDVPRIENSSELLLSGDFFQVGNSLKFIQWRYKDPRYRRVQFTVPDGKLLYIIYRMDRIKGLKTVVLCDTYGDYSILQKALRRILSREYCNFVYFLENSYNKGISPFLALKHRNALITFKGNNYNIPDKLVISLGDLEGKL